jgi:5-methylcytosine-specific restriction endonuclease McrA
MTGISTKFSLKEIEKDVELEKKKKAILVEHNYIHKGRYIPKTLYCRLKQTRICMECGRPLRPTEIPQIHHIQPKKKGGKNYEKNLIAVCEACHNRLDTEAFKKNGGN